MGLTAWLAGRIGLDLGERLARPVPRESAWSVAAGAALLTLVAAQAASGALLAAYYKPAWKGAHASVEMVLTQIPAGWLVRSVHVWGAHLILAGTLLHLARTFLRGGARAPRELAWMTLVLLMAAAAGAAITGQMLPMDEEAVAGAFVASDFANAAGVGKLVRGGPDVGEFMLGRFFAAHAFWIPAAGLALLAVHLAASARHPGGGEPGPTALRCVGLPALGTVALLATLAVAWPAGLGPASDGSHVTEGTRPIWLFVPAYWALRVAPAWAVLLATAAVLAGALALPFVRRRA